jgi:putative flippase GtrA
MSAARVADQAPSTLARWMKFNVVGAIGMSVQFSALFLLKSVLHFDYLFATAVAVEAAVMHNFIWHEQFTWADRLEPSWRSSSRRLLRFNLTTGLLSMVGNLALMKVMVEFGGLNYLLANALAIALCSIANFVVSEQWIFPGPSAAISANPISRRSLPGEQHHSEIFRITLP